MNDETKIQETTVSEEISTESATDESATDESVKFKSNNTDVITLLRNETKIRIASSGIVLASLCCVILCMIGIIICANGCIFNKTPLVTIGLCSILFGVFIGTIFDVMYDYRKQLSYTLANNKISGKWYLDNIAMPTHRPASMTSVKINRMVDNKNSLKLVGEFQIKKPVGNPKTIYSYVIKYDGFTDSQIDTIKNYIKENCIHED